MTYATSKRSKELDTELVRTFTEKSPHPAFRQNRRYIRAGVAVVALFFQSGFAEAERISSIRNGNELLAVCSSNNELDQAVCKTYVSAVFRTYDMISFNDKPEFCVPDSVTYQQLIDVVVAYLRANPTNRHQQAVMHTVNALLGAWYCSDQ